MRQGDPDWQAFHHDLYRAVGAARGEDPAHKGRWWIMEQQPGPVNWAPWNPAPLDGMPRLWAWEAFAHGAEAVCYFRWRQAPFAQEQMHAGLLRPDSKAAPALAEAAQVAAELASLGDLHTEKADVAILFDYPSAWAWEAQPQGADFDYFDLVFDHYKALRKLGLNVDFISATSPQVPDPDYKLVLAPGVLSLTDGTAQGFSSGKTVLIGPRTNSKTPALSIPTPMGPNIPGLDVTVSRVESLPPFAPLPAGQGEIIKWFEHLEGDAEVFAHTSDGRPYVVRSGENVYYQAGWPDQDLAVHLLEQLCQTAGIQTTRMPEGLRQRVAGKHRFLFNYDAEPASIGGLTLPPAGVHWD